MSLSRSALYKPKTNKDAPVDALEEAAVHARWGRVSAFQHMRKDGRAPMGLQTRVQGVVGDEAQLKRRTTNGSSHVRSHRLVVQPR